jgi:hypothetical protein
VRRREGRYLLRTNLGDPAELIMTKLMIMTKLTVTDSRMKCSKC